MRCLGGYKGASKGHGINDLKEIEEPSPLSKYPENHVMRDTDCHILCYIHNITSIYENIYKHEYKKTESSSILFTCEPAAALLIRLLLG